ncbi:MAG: HypC/HybG/HupF family hydrogenase formation chaperone [Candidatus Omnitrophica bacterium]|nr:HypC/HybG/HupF family hydrogenase formation chaperone [Candidatus Omnitrophota bacterium]
MCLAVPGEITHILKEDALSRVGQVRFGGIFKEVNLTCVPEAKKGDYVLVHVGFAIATIDREEAEETLGYLQAMDELGESEGLRP